MRWWLLIMKFVGNIMKVRSESEQKNQLKLQVQKICITFISNLVTSLLINMSSATAYQYSLYKDYLQTFLFWKVKCPSTCYREYYVKHEKTPDQQFDRWWKFWKSWKCRKWNCNFSSLNTKFWYDMICFICNFGHFNWYLRFHPLWYTACWSPLCSHELSVKVD